MNKEIQGSLWREIWGYSPIFLPIISIDQREILFCHLIIKDLSDKDILAGFSMKNDNSIRFLSPNF